MPRRQIGGGVSLLKTAGQTGGIYLANGAQIDIPILMAEPVNATQIVRIETINGRGTLNQRLQAKKMPAFRATALLKSWASAALLADFLTSYDANGNSSAFTARFQDGGSGTLSDRQFQGCKLVNLNLTGSGASSEMRAVMDFAGIKADGDVSVTDTFASYTTNYGNTWGATDINWGGTPTATDVTAWSLNLTRIQIAQFFADGLAFASRITSGPLRGNAMIMQDPDAATVPTTGFTLRFGSTGTGAPVLTPVLDLDQIVYGMEAGPAVLGQMVRLFTLADNVSANGVVLGVSTW